MFSRVADEDALLISLDVPPNGHGFGYPHWRKKLFKSFARARQRIELVQADSHDLRTPHHIQKLLGDRELDLLFIDGDHSYEGVRKDYELYTPLVRKGGLIVFHDIVPCPPKRRCGVPQFWQEMKQLGQVTEFVSDWGQGGYGIGIMKK